MRSDGEVKYWETLKKMTPAQKLRAVMHLYWTARELKAAGLRLRYPNVPEAEIQKRVRDLFLYAVD